jgi:hypothetical protein
MTVTAPQPTPAKPWIEGRFEENLVLTSVAARVFQQLEQRLRP